MEQQSSASKVTVEYFDPHHVFKLIAPGLVPRLPLRNLHWQSHAGPLRSIGALHVDLVPGNAASSPEPGAATDQSPSSGASRDDGFLTQQVGGQDAASDFAEKPTQASNLGPGGQRRHQIPGLRNTPYLKILLVRCDDNDIYKGTVRSEIREWVKQQTPPSTSSKKANKQEKHDAFEWLIIHVVIPNTVAATQPRSSGGKADGASAERGVSSSRWRTGSTPLLEKLRSDFNSSSKGSPDRVAQIRIGINDVPYDILPKVVPAVPSGYSESEGDAEHAWSDLMSKLKSLILSSFDFRVMQYEEDIKEKDGQRSIPGWNFCTFFILKEGLARGFENVGLVEDALVGYDELSVGLDTIIQEQTEGGSPEKHGGAMLAYTEELKVTARQVLSQLSEEGEEDEAEDLQRKDPSNSQVDDIPISSSRKAYRDMILANQVSVFDFRCYIFSRQISLLLRLGNSSATKEELLAKLRDQRESVLHGVAPLVPPMNTDNSPENLDVLSEVCRRTLEFIPLISQILRQDICSVLLSNANHGDADGPQSAELEPAHLEAMSNIIASFAFTVAQQILAQTSTKALPIPPTTLSRGDGNEPKSSIPEPKTMMHPARTSSLHVQSLPPPPLSPGFPGPGRQMGPTDQQESTSSSFLKIGLEELAARRAELYMLSRSILDGLGKKRGWSNGWDEAPLVGGSDTDDMAEVSLDNSEEKPTVAKQTIAPFTVGIESQILRTAAEDQDDFNRLYEILTDKALRHFTVANHNHAVHGCQADLAVLKFHMKDFQAAANRFVSATPFFGFRGWSLVELSMLVMYCQCLGELNSNDDFASAALTLLTKSCAAARERRLQKATLAEPRRETQIKDVSPIRDVARRLFLLSKDFSTELKVILGNFFMDIELDGSPEYHDQKDSCSLVISLRSLLPNELVLDAVRLRITCIDGGPCRDIDFENSEKKIIHPGKNTISVKTNHVVPGSYRVSRLALASNKLLFHHEQDTNQLPPRTSDVFRRPDVTLFQRTTCLDVQLTASKEISLGGNNALDLIVTPGWNYVKNCDVRIRPMTGGLRLLTTEATLDATASLARPPEPGAVYLGPLKAYSSTTVRFPYSIEQDLGDVSVKVEATYATGTDTEETFHFAKYIIIPVALAVGVNVQDVFKHNVLFSRFNVETASASPLRLLKSELARSELFEPSSGLPPPSTLMIFPKQQATLLYKITRKAGADVTQAGRTLHLTLHYSVLQAEIEDVIQQSVIQGLRGTPLELYSMLMAARVLAETRNGLQAYDLERAALVGEVTTAYLKGVPWTRHFHGIGFIPGTKTNAANELATFLDAWQKQHPRITLPGPSADTLPHSITIPVELPSLFVVHTADIRIDASVLEPFKGSGAPAAMVNQLLPAVLHLRWTRAWDTDGVAREDEEFSFEVTAPLESWLIGGRRKGHFVIPGGKTPSSMSSTLETEAEIPLVLIPQREGYLPYPNVDIKKVIVAANEAGQQQQQQPAPCEVDWRNIGETLRVVSQRRSVTVSLDASGPGGGPLVFESEAMERPQARVVA